MALWLERTARILHLAKSHLALDPARTPWHGAQERRIGSSDLRSDVVSRSTIHFEVAATAHGMLLLKLTTVPHTPKATTRRHCAEIL